MKNLYNSKGTIFFFNSFVMNLVAIAIVDNVNKFIPCKIVFTAELFLF